jgi:formylglycine-generating enzyme required for sulfatase activity
LTLQLAQPLADLPDPAWSREQMEAAVEQWLQLHDVEDSLAQGESAFEVLLKSANPGGDLSAELAADTSFHEGLRAILERIDATHAASLSALLHSHANEVRAQHEEATWHQTREENTKEAYLAYLKTDGLLHTHAEEARKRIDDIVWEAAARQDTLAAYRAYLVDARLIQRHRQEAELRIATLVRAASRLKKVIRVAQDQQRRTADMLGKQVVFCDSAFDVCEYVRVLVKEAGWFSSAQYESRRVEMTVIPPQMAIIPPGQFLMGSPDDEPGRGDDEGPQHMVIITKPFALARFAVTFQEYDAYCDATGGAKPNDEGWGRGKRPVINVSWHDAIAYCNWLSEKTKAEYRLPTEAEWEYACRARTNTPFWWGDRITTEQANYGRSPYTKGMKGKTVLVCQFEPNPWGLYQMHGNVREWVQDGFADYSSEAKKDFTNDELDEVLVQRGGSCLDEAAKLRAACRLTGEKM